MIKVGLFLLIYAMCALAKDKASLDLVVYELTSSGDWYNTFSTTVEGNFSVAGATTSAEGPLYQMHPSGLCNIVDDEDLIEYGWIGVVKMEDPKWVSEPCMSLYLKVQHAMQRGAAAMIIDITEDQQAAVELQNAVGPKLEKPIVLLNGHSADKLMQVVSANKQPHARIEVKRVKLPVQNKGKVIPVTQPTTEQGSSNSTMMDMGIFIGCFVVFCIVCVVIILKFKFRQQDRQGTILEQAQDAVAKFKTHSYVCKNPPRPRSRSSDMYSLDSNSELCAVCLEEYKDGQELIVLPCAHEFHKKCVYSWLVEQRTCPLCVHNILEHSKNEASCSRSVPRPSPPHSIINIPLQPSRGLSSGTGSDSLISLPAQIKVTRGANALRMTVDGRRTMVMSRDMDETSHTSSNYTSHKSRIYKKRNSSRDSRHSRSEHVALLHLGRTENCERRGNLGASSISSSRGHERVPHSHRDRSRSNERSSERGNRSDNNNARGKREKAKELQHSFTKGAKNYDHPQKMASSLMSSGHDSSKKHSTELQSVRLKEKERPMSDTYEECPTCQCCKQTYKTPERTSSEKDLQAEFNQPLLPSGGCSEHQGECDCHVDSNQSTYGSSDTVPSDISSCDSNVYSAKCEKLFKDSSTQVKGFETLPLRPIQLKPQCLASRPSGGRLKHSSKTLDHRLSDSSNSSYENELQLRSLVQRATSHRTRPNLCNPRTDMAISPLVSDDSDHGDQRVNQFCSTRHVLPGVYTPYDLTYMQPLRPRGNQSVMNGDSHVTIYERQAFLSTPRHDSPNFCAVLAEQLQYAYCQREGDRRGIEEGASGSRQSRGHHCSSSQCKRCHSSRSRKGHAVVYIPEQGTCTTKAICRDEFEGDPV